jgi:predicted RNA binding protein YcfA (HicA-like mRNA interferase family)
MANLPNLKPREIAEILLKAGFVEDTTKSAHRTYRHPSKGRYTTVSFHPGTIPQGTLRAIIKQSGMTLEEFLSFRKRK